MAIYDNDGTKNIEIGKLYDNNGSVDTQIDKVYDNNGSVNSLIYQGWDGYLFKYGGAQYPEITGGWSPYTKQGGTQFSSSPHLGMRLVSTNADGYANWHTNSPVDFSKISAIYIGNSNPSNIYMYLILADNPYAIYHNSGGIVRYVRIPKGDSTQGIGTSDLNGSYYVCVGGYRSGEWVWNYANHIWTV